MAMVLQANKESSELGGHIASYQSAATLYEVGFNHFWHAPSDGRTAATSSTSRATPSPGIYARAFLEGRLDRGAAARASARRSTTGRFDGRGSRPTRTRG